MERTSVQAIASIGDALLGCRAALAISSALLAVAVSLAAAQAQS